MNHNDNGTIAVGAAGSLMRRLTELPEPTEYFPPLTEDNPRTHTPWGSAQSASHYGRGLIMYSTASHGGFHVSNGLLSRIPDYLQSADKYADGTAGWYEEDCAWAIVVVCIPERFRLEARMDAVRIMQNVYPEQWQRFVSA